MIPTTLTSSTTMGASTNTHKSFPRFPRVRQRKPHPNQWNGCIPVEHLHGTLWYVHGGWQHLYGKDQESEESVAIPRWSYSLFAFESDLPLNGSVSSSSQMSFPFMYFSL